jgi:formate hydrogenlyase transcriptional activator
MQRTSDGSSRLRNGDFPSADHDQELLRFARRLDAHYDPWRLLQALPGELRDLISSNTVAVIYPRADGITWYAIGTQCGVTATPSVDGWTQEIWSFARDCQQAFVISALDREKRFPEAVKFFQECGNQSLCVLPLCAAVHPLAALCIGRKGPDAFSEKEIRFFSLVADFVALAVDGRINFAAAENIRAQLENEHTKLKLILDLNNSVVSNLELREVLRSISPSIRKVLCLDAVGLILPDAEGSQLQLFASDFPDGKGLLHQDMLSPVASSLSGHVFRSGKLWIGDVSELRNSGFDHRTAKVEGLETLCMLPLSRCNRVLGVLCLARLSKNAFTRQDIEFLTLIAGQVAIAIDNAFAYRQISELKDKLTQEKLYLQDELRSEMNFEEIIGNSPVLRRVLRQVEAVAPTGSTVLIHGETGTGKELIARAVHNLSQRRSNAFVKLNCAAIPAGLLESEFFGHEKGAFTGATAQRTGRFELASQGTIFLDEVGEIPLDLQPKLLRVLQEREFERLGGSRTFRTDARLIAATNRDLGTMVDERRFRSDLFYRLNVFPIQVPPLRERTEDIPFLVRHFAQHFARNMTRQIDTIPSQTMNALVRYPWPGNIRELQNVIERAVILSEGPVLKVPLTDLRPRTAESASTNGAATLEEVERRHILSVLEQTNWVFAGPYGAAARLGIKRPTLQFRMRKLGISRPKRPQL